METLIIALAAFLASGLTLFTGFGLGTLLMPVIALFFPVEMAIGISALVHLANNLFKLGLLGRMADLRVVLRFGLPAILAAVAGAWLLGWLAQMTPLAEYTLAGREFAVMPVKVIIGLLILVFVVLELIPAFESLALDARYLPLGGCISGFFGGLSGNQGAFRSMFLLKVGLSKESFIATGVVLAALVDLARVPVYAYDFMVAGREVNWIPVGMACLAAFSGAFLGARLIKKVELGTLKKIVSALLILVALGLVSGAL
ncbi:MAG: sulfite exporter TauE/SafE family protein [Prosthecobacter sp.]|nr:sulfite exporter TauE/SafE family protein [Prosthecobacter sp.]